ncbi:heavy metal translocating P-type ATPase, partial [Candidatus Glomeribacter gigasporarum]|uniref:heavy metal translocating P-type ATPase n=1 Tax=Candidatus Glomeribacter gigasporarum TaxID=132144 RepID=UPI0013159234
MTQGKSLKNALEPARRNVWRLILAGGAALGSEAAQWLGQPGAVSAGLALLAILACGVSVYQKGGRAIRAFQFNIYALMSIAVTGACLLGQWPEAAMVMALFTLAEWLEARALGRARHAMDMLMRLAPDKALVQQANGHWQEMEAKDVAAGSRVRVAPGARIALDGIVLKGRSAVNQAAITGESLPVEKAEGDHVFAGTVNGAGALEYRTTAAASHTTLARIIHAVEHAQGAKAPTVRLIDRFSRLYTPAVLVAAFAIAFAGPWIWGGGWVGWIYKALVLLVIACPCALVISTPVTIVSGLAACARRGILIKGGLYLEEGRRLKRLAFDKTGTLTCGQPVQTDFETWAQVDARTCCARAAALAAGSDHPVSQAIVQHVSEQGIIPRATDSMEALPGYGLRGAIGGKAYALGNHRLVEMLKRCSPRLEARIRAFEQEGKTVVMLLDERQVLALFAVADTVKESSRAAIASLHALGVKTVMLSGDNHDTVRAIARQVG